MPADRVVSQDYEVESRLNQLGLTASELISIVHEAVAAKAGFVLNHPLNAGGSCPTSTAPVQSAIRSA